MNVINWILSPASPRPPGSLRIYTTGFSKQEKLLLSFFKQSNTGIRPYNYCTTFFVS